MRDLKGFRYLERLLADPGREFHVLDLVAVERGTFPVRVPPSTTAWTPWPKASERASPSSMTRPGDAYRRRLAEVDDDIDEATQLNDIGRVELAQR